MFKYVVFFAFFLLLFGVKYSFGDGLTANYPTELVMEEQPVVSLQEIETVIPTLDDCWVEETESTTVVPIGSVAGGFGVADLGRGFIFPIGGGYVSDSLIIPGKTIVCPK